MNQVLKLGGPEPREILKDVIEKKVPAILSYSSKGKWHVSKVILTDFGAQRLTAELCHKEKPRPLNIQLDQRVGMSIKYGYGKFIFDTVVLGLGPPSKEDSAGTIIMKMPERIELVQRRSYFRVDVPELLRVEVKICRRGRQENNTDIPDDHCCRGRLIDISAGGLQAAVEAVQKPVFKKGQFVQLTFVPVPYQEPLFFTAQIRNVLPTADQRHLCYGLQTVGLESSPAGRQTLARLVEVVENYYQISKAGTGQIDDQSRRACRKSIGEDRD